MDKEDLTPTYNHLQFSRADIQYAIYFAAEHGAIIRAKKGSTDSLSLP